MAAAARGRLPSRRCPSTSFRARARGGRRRSSPRRSTASRPSTRVSADIRWIRSYIVQEDDGTFSGFCVYEASDPEALLRHAEAMKLPTDAIKPVVSTIVAAPDPEPVTA